MAAAEEKTRGGTIWQCVRCGAQTNRGRRCTRRTCKYADMCWQHVRSLYGVRIAASTLPDAHDGLFATRDFQEEEVIVFYGDPNQNQWLDQWQEQGLTHTDYWLPANADLVRDARSTQSGLGRWVNDCRPVNRPHDCEDTTRAL